MNVEDGEIEVCTDEFQKFDSEQIIYVNNVDNTIGIFENIAMQSTIDTSNAIIHQEHLEENTSLNLENPDDFTQILLSEKECSTLESCGYVVLHRNFKRYLLDSEGIKLVPDWENDTSNIVTDGTEEHCGDPLNINKISTEENFIRELPYTELKLGSEEYKDTTKETYVDNESSVTAYIYPVNQGSNEESLISTNVAFGQINDNNMHYENTLVLDGATNKIISLDYNDKSKMIAEIKILESNNECEKQNDLYSNCIVNSDDTNADISQIYMLMDENMENSESNEDKTITVEKHNEVFNDKRILIGNTPDGKNLYGRIIDFKTPDGSTITNDKFENLSSKIKKILGNMFSEVTPQVNSGAQYNPGTTSEKETDENSVVNRQSEMTVTFEAEHVPNNTYSNDVKKEISFSNDTSVPETRNELVAIKKTLETLVPYIKSNPKHQFEYSQLVSRNLLIYKKSSGKIGEKSKMVSKEYVFTGRLYGSDEAGWEFMHLPELSQKSDEADEKSKNFFTIKIVPDEKLKDKSTQIVIFENKQRESEQNTVISNTDNTWDVKYETKKINGKKHYGCNVCKKYFHGLTHFKKHVKIHSSKTPEDIIKCHLCDCVFSYHSTLTRHIVEVHRDAVTYASTMQTSLS